METIIKSKIISGTQRGRKLGFPTANLEIIKLGKLEFGVYICEVSYENKKYKGLLHYGQRKTFEGKITAEVLILGFKGNLYGREIEVKIKQKIRKTRKFNSEKELILQIRKDIDFLKNNLNTTS